MPFLREKDLIERFENITKPPNDQRSYKGLKLSNRMKVMLVSDPSAEKSAAAMSIGVGEFQRTE